MDLPVSTMSAQANGNGVHHKHSKFTSLIINGVAKPASDGSTFEVKNSYHKVVGVSACATARDCEDAINAAAEAFPAWEKSPLVVRGHIFTKAADLIQQDKYKKRIVESIMEETTCNKDWAMFNWGPLSSYLRTVATLTAGLRGETLPSVAGGQVMILRKAMGVVFAIAPWNAPFTLTLRAVCVPILCGNTVVLKPSEYSPKCQGIIVELLEEAGLPKGVLNYIPISREASPKLCADIIAHSKVRIINFTGSDRVGRILASHAGKFLKPCVFELGGKSPMLVLNDANVKDAARAVVYGALAHSGQVCMSTERVIVQRGIYEALKTQVVALFKSIKAGDPTDAAFHLSPLFSEGSADNIVDMMQDAKEQGAEVLVGDLKKNGAIIQPHLLTGVKPGMKLWEHESFGPVSLITPFDTIEEGIELANATDYTLASSLWTTNIHDAMTVAQSIRASYVNINGSTFHSEPLLTVSGQGGSSGYGRFDIEHFSNKVTVIMHPPNKQYALFNSVGETRMNGH